MTEPEVYTNDYIRARIRHCVANGDKQTARFYRRWLFHRHHGLAIIGAPVGALIGFGSVILLEGLMHR